MKKIIIISGIVSACIFLIQCDFNLSADEAFEKGKRHYTRNEKKKAYKYFNIAAKKSFNNASYQWAAARSAPNPNLAFVHSKAAWENGLKTPDVLLSIINLSFYFEKDKKLEYALTLYNQLPETFKNDQFRGVIHEKFQQYDSAIVLWMKAFDKSPSAELCNKIAYAYGKNRQMSKAKKFLEQCRKEKLLDGNGYIMLAHAAALDYEYTDAAQIFNEARMRGLYGLAVQIEHAGFFIIEGKFADAENVLSAALHSGSVSQSHALTQRARIMLSFLYYLRKDKENIEKLIKDRPANTAESKAELSFYQTLSAMLAHDNDKRELLDRIDKSLPRYPVIELLHARENAASGNYEDAVESYRKLPEIFQNSPGIIVEFAAALTKTGRYDEALALINTMHKHKKFTRNSLELFRDLAFKKDLLDQSMAAQKLLEQKYKNDAGILYKKALFAIKAGDNDTALRIFTRLANKYPQEERFEISRIAVYLLKEEYETLIKESNNSKLAYHVLSPFIAQAYIKLQQPQRAEEVYRKSLEEKKTIRMMLEYAQFLINNQKPEKAADIYKELIEEQKDKLAEDSSGNAVILNNFAWALLQNPDSDKKFALTIAQKAHSLLPSNVHILDTYISALNETKNYDKCIDILRNNVFVNEEPKLLYYLALAYEIKGDLNKAVRLYQNLDKQQFSKAQLRFDKDQVDIKKKVSELLPRL